VPSLTIGLGYVGFALHQRAKGFVLDILKVEAASRRFSSAGNGASTFSPRPIVEETLPTQDVFKNVPNSQRGPVAQIPRVVRVCGTKASET
jgi:hypothetical protein